MTSPDPAGQPSCYPAIRALAALVAHDLAAAKLLLDEAARPLVEHGSRPRCSTSVCGRWSRRWSTGRDERPVRSCAGRPGVLRRATRGALLLRRRDRRRPDRAATRLAEQAFAAGDDLLARLEWWRRFLRLFTLEAAIADGWGAPVPVLRADLSAYEQAGGARWPGSAATCCAGPGADPAGPRRLAVPAALRARGRDQPGARRAPAGRRGV